MIIIHFGAVEHVSVAALTQAGSDSAEEANYGGQRPLAPGRDRGRLAVVRAVDRYSVGETVRRTARPRRVVSPDQLRFGTHAEGFASGGRGRQVC